MEPANKIDMDKKQQLAAAIEQLRIAMITADRRVLTSLAHARLTYGHSDASLEDKFEFAEAIASGQSVFETLEFPDQTMEVLDDMAIVRHRFIASTNDKGKGPATVRLSVLQVWVYEEEQWLLLARQSVRLPLA